MTRQEIASAHAGECRGWGVQAYCRCQQETNNELSLKVLPIVAEDILQHSQQATEAPVAASKHQLAGQSSMQQPAAQASDFLHRDGEPMVKQIRQASVVLLSQLLPCAPCLTVMDLRAISLMPHQTAQ